MSDPSPGLSGPVLGPSLALATATGFTGLMPLEMGGPRKQSQV